MIGTVPCTEPAVARETNDSIEKGVLLASPSAASPFGTPGVQTLRGGGLTPISSSRTPSSTLRTPASVIRRESTGGMQNIVRTPQRQTGILDYITGFYR